MRPNRVIRFLFLLYSIYIIIRLVFICTIKQCFIIYDNRFHLERFNLSDWLINYSDGFVRRGLWGEIILYLYNTFNIDIAQSIIWITIISTTALILFTIYFFKKKGLSFFLLPNVILLGSFAMNNILCHRRDALMLLLIFLALYFYKRWIEERGRRLIYYILLSLTGIFVILTHEASFFCFVPFITFDYFIRNKNRLLVQRVTSTVFFILPMLFTMGCACIFKGNEEVANNIWNSYAPYFQERFGEMLPMGEGVNALAWGTEDTIKFHLSTNFLAPMPLLNGVPTIFAWCIIFFFAFYLMVNVNKVKLFNYERTEIENVHLATILLIQFVSLLPMFTVLSCDLGRIFTYWSLTSFVIFGLFQSKRYPLFSYCGNKLFTLYHQMRIQSKWFYIIISLIICVPFIGFADPLSTSILGGAINILRDLF